MAEIVLLGLGLLWLLVFVLLVWRERPLTVSGVGVLLLSSPAYFVGYGAGFFYASLLWLRATVATGFEDAVKADSTEGK